jgi:hypothetical protein
LFIGLGTDFWGVAVCVLPQNVYFLESEFLPVYIKLIPTVFSLVGGITATLFYFNFDKIFVNLISINIMKYLYIFFAKRWFFDIYYFEKLAKPLLGFGYYVTFRYLDRGIIEWIGPYGLVKIIQNVSAKISFISSGYIYHYFMISLVTFLLLCMVFVNFGFMVVWLDFVTLFFIGVMLLFMYVLI